MRKDKRSSLLDLVVSNEEKKDSRRWHLDFRRWHGLVVADDVVGEKSLSDAVSVSRLPLHLDLHPGVDRRQVLKWRRTFCGRSCKKSVWPGGACIIKLITAVIYDGTCIIKLITAAIFGFL
jgi:hypothetical protein